MRFILILLFSLCSFSQQQVLPMLLDSDVAPPITFGGEFQFLFENNTNEETGNHTPTSTGAFTYIAGPNAYNGQAVRLNSSQAINIPASANFSTNQFTIAFFISRSAFPSGFDAILEHDRFGTNWYGVFAASSGGQLNVRTSNTGVDDLTTSVTWNTNEWYHIIFTYDGTTGTVYRNGTNILSSAMTANTVNLSAINLFQNLTNGEGLVADIDRFEFWAVGKNTTEIANIYDCALNGNNCNN